jgi:IS605 OrfB family transposase
MAKNKTQPSILFAKKIQLLINTDDKEKYVEAWRYLRNLNNDVFKAANAIITHQLFNEKFAETILLSNAEITEKREELRGKVDNITIKIKEEKDKEKKKKLLGDRKKLYRSIDALSNDARAKMEEIYGTSQENTTYRLLEKDFPNMPSYVKSSLNRSVVKGFKNDLFEVNGGLRSVRSYKKGMPIPFMKTAMRFEKLTNGDVLMQFFNGINFKLFFGRDNSGNEEAIDSVISGAHELSDSSIRIVDKKIFLNLVIRKPREIKKALDKSVCVGVDIGLNVPACCALSTGHERLFLGDRNTLVHQRTQMQQRKRLLTRSLQFTNGGRGRDKKLKALETIKASERNFVHTYNHTISSRIVKFAISNNAGTIKLELLDGFSEKHKNSFVLRNWSYYELQNMIKCKAVHEGVEVVFVDPYHTSQTCAKCGHYEEGQRCEKEVWKFTCKNSKCKNHNKTVNADYNAAKNIAASDKVVTSKSECEYYKKHGKEGSVKEAELTEAILQH